MVLKNITVFYSFFNYQQLCGHRNWHKLYTNTIEDETDWSLYIDFTLVLLYDMIISKIRRTDAIWQSSKILLSFWLWHFTENIQ